MTRFWFYPPDKRRRFETYAAEFAAETPSSVPWMPLRRGLSACKAILVTTSALRPKADRPFGSSGAEFRWIPIARLRSGVAFDHPDLDASEAARDLSVLLPVDAVVEQVELRRLGELDEAVVSLSGRCEDPAALERGASEIGDRLRESQVDLALIFAAALPCNQTIALLARGLERRGVSTLCLMTIREVAETLRVPRAAFVNFPFGRPLGPAFRRDLRLRIVEDLLAAAARLDRPGRIVDLPYEWDGGPQ